MTPTQTLHDMFDEIPDKRCTKCKIRKPFDQFYSAKLTRDGRSTWCKACQCARVKKSIPVTLFPTSKICVKCKEDKPIDDYGRISHTRDGRIGRCKSCVSIYNKLRQNRPSAKTEHRRSNIKQKYNLSLEDYDELLNSQNGVCAICGGLSTGKSKSKFLHVDHDHVTGKIRGLLCNKCNVSLGCFKDNVEILKNAIRYLENDR